MGKNAPNPKAVKEFLSEAQEFVEELSNGLMEIDRMLRDREEVDPDVINEAFRCWHTLKGLSSTFGAEPLAHLAHREETLLDQIRLGRTRLTEEVLDALLLSVDAVVDALNQIRESGDLTRVQIKQRESVAAPQPPSVQPGTAGAPDLKGLVPASILEVLTEFEEHRLVTSIGKGRPLYRIRAGFSLLAIDTELEAIKNILKPLGEIITYLPCDESSAPDKLDIEVLLALKGRTDELERVVSDQQATMELVLNPGETVIRISEPSPAAARAEVPEDIAARASIEPVATPGSGASRLELAKDQALSLRSVSQTVRVDISKLDRLMNSVGELGLVRSSISKVSEELRAIAGRRDLAIELHRIARGFERRLAEIREGILEVRMVPVGQMFDRLSRVIRKVSRNLGKEIQFIVSGADTEVDKLIIEELSDPLMHIIRNAIDHGIESVEERRLLGKPEMGTVALTAYQKGNHVLIEVEDDGAGIDGDRIVEAAVRAGALSREQAELLSEREINHLIFLPGISTAKETTEISGRGVGMDVVKTNISSLGGIVEVESEPGIGTKFTITMPVTLAITPALLVRVESGTYAIPLNSVAEALILFDADVKRVMNTDTLTLRGQTLPLCRLDVFFNIYREGPPPPNSRVVVATLGHRRVGLVVDALVGQQDVIIKPLGASLAKSGCFSGVTDIGNQKLALVLDTVSVIEEFFASAEETGQHAG